MAATVGWGRSADGQVEAVEAPHEGPRSRSRVGPTRIRRDPPRPCDPIMSRSPPAEKARPEPVSTTARTESSLARARRRHRCDGLAHGLGHGVQPLGVVEGEGRRRRRWRSRRTRSDMAAEPHAAPARRTATTRGSSAPAAGAGPEDRTGPGRCSLPALQERMGWSPAAAVVRRPSRARRRCEARAVSVLLVLLLDCPLAQEGRHRRTRPRRGRRSSRPLRGASVRRSPGRCDSIRVTGSSRHRLGLGRGQGLLGSPARGPGPARAGAAAPPHRLRRRGARSSAASARVSSPARSRSSSRPVAMTVTRISPSGAVLVDHGAEDDVGVLVGRLLHQGGGLVHLPQGHVRAARDVDQHAPGAVDADASSSSGLEIAA